MSQICWETISAHYTCVCMGCVSETQQAVDYRTHRQKTTARLNMCDECGEGGGGGVDGYWGKALIVSLELEWQQIACRSLPRRHFVGSLQCFAAPPVSSVAWRRGRPHHAHKLPHRLYGDTKRYSYTHASRRTLYCETVQIYCRKVCLVQLIKILDFPSFRRHFRPSRFVVLGETPAPHTADII